MNSRSFAHQLVAVLLAKSASENVRNNIATIRVSRAGNTGRLGAVQLGLLTLLIATAARGQDQAPPEAPANPTIDDCAKLYDRYTQLQIKNAHDAVTDEAKAKEVSTCMKRVRASHGKKAAKDRVDEPTSDSSSANIGVSAECDPDQPLYAQKLASSPDPAAYAKYCAGQVAATESETSNKSKNLKAGSIQFTDEETLALRTLYENKKLMLELGGFVKGFKEMNDKLAEWSPGPVGFALKMTEKDLDLADEAVKRMDKNIVGPADCIALAGPEWDTPNGTPSPHAAFFRRLRDVLGCEN